MFLQATEQFIARGSVSEESFAKTRGPKPSTLKRLFPMGAVVATAALVPLLASAQSVPSGGSEFKTIPAQAVGQLPDYSSDVANEEAYWYSRYTLGALAHQSGMGVPIPMSQLQAVMPSMMAAVGAAPDDPIVIPQNLAVLEVVYAGGDPHYLTTPVFTNFATLRWAGGPPKLTTAAMAFTMTKELEWAKMFHRDRHFGQAGVDHFGATWRLTGLVFATQAKAQFMAYMASPQSFSNSTVGDYAMLQAFSDAAGMYSSPDQANNQGPNAVAPSYPTENRYADPISAAQFQAAAAQLFQKVLAYHPRSTRELSLGIQAVVWYAAVTTDSQELGEASAAVHRWAAHLIRSDADSPADLAYKVRGLIEAGRVTGNEGYLREAAEAFNEMTEDMDLIHGVLRGTRTLTTDDIGEIAGAFNSAMIWLGNRIDQTTANTLFGGWWEGNVDLSGFMLSLPAINVFKSPFELLDPPGRGTQLQNPMNYRYPTVPLPGDAGGQYGIATVMSASVTWDKHALTWTADQSHFDTAGAFHTASEFMWFHSDEVSGFPDVILP